MESLLLRHVAHGRAVAAFPSTVVERTNTTLAACIAPATPIMYPRGRDAGGTLIPFEEWEVERRAWVGPPGFELTTFGRRHSIRHMRHKDGSFRGWYVNLQAPLTETRLGYDTTDWQLDLWIPADSSVAQWKDEADLARALELGIMTADEGRFAREEAERVIDEWPFPTGWEDWQPDPEWPLPPLTEDWDVV
jgi:hypothetical protein